MDLFVLFIYLETDVVTLVSKLIMTTITVF